MHNLRNLSGKTACPLLFLALAHTVSATSIPDRVRDAIVVAAPGLHAELRPDGGIQVTGSGGELTVYTDNVQKQCEQSADQCSATIQRFVSAVVSAATETQNLTLTESNVYPVIRSIALLRTLRDTFHQQPKRVPIARPFTSDSTVLYAIDSSKAMRFASDEDLERQGLSEERLQAIAVANASRLEPVKVSLLPNSSGLFVTITEDGYATSRLFDPKFAQSLEQTAGGPVIVAVPTRDWIIAARADDAAAITKLKDVAARVFRGEAYAVTPKLVKWDGKAWIEVPP